MLLLFTALFFASPGAATTAHQPRIIDAGFDASFDAILDDAGVPGGAWAIIADGEVARSGAHGVRALDDPRPVDPGTVFRIASLSKTFAAGLAAMLSTTAG